MSKQGILSEMVIHLTSELIYLVLQKIKPKEGGHLYLAFQIAQYFLLGL
jgi:hypothetical protein